MTIYRDGVELTIDPQHGIKVSTTRDGHVVETFYVGGRAKHFVTLRNSFYCAHGNTIAEAVADAEWKNPERRPSRESLVREIQAAGKDRKISLSEFRLLTGACSEGCRIAVERAKVTGDPMTAFDIRDIVSKDWGNKLLDILGWSQ